MGKASESIFDGSGSVIPMAEVSHIERFPDTKSLSGRICVIFKHSKWNEETQSFEPNAYFDNNSNSVGFMSSWCRYRSEIESETLISDPHA